MADEPKDELPKDDAIPVEVTDPTPPAETAPPSAPEPTEAPTKPGPPKKYTLPPPNPDRHVVSNGGHKNQQTGDAPPRTVHGLNFTLAFVLFVNGMTLPEIAKEFDFDFQKLATRAKREKWRVLAAGSYDRLYRKDRKNPESRVELKEGEMEKKMEAKIAEIGKNRGKITDMADTLRAQIQRVADALNKLPIDSLTDHEQIANITKSIGSLTKAAKDIADMSMVALGDEHVIRHMGANFNKPGAGTGGPMITINMPGILATSRRRQLKPADRLEDDKEELRLTEKHVRLTGAKISADLNDGETADDANETEKS